MSRLFWIVVIALLVFSPAFRKAINMLLFLMFGSAIQAAFD